MEIEIIASRQSKSRVCGMRKKIFFFVKLERKGQERNNLPGRKFHFYFLFICRGARGPTATTGRRVGRTDATATNTNGTATNTDGTATATLKI